ncbi:hypothetical protein [Paraburkholderia caffeinitolerans]|uniref:hypothetical protein n=1 Tax=Paraburkholderia caffeinitolerans TaxID=1723730 RepID=UPI00158208F1|nr:hypothetical protein [Paraburkholderia caffeinitolerans]
MRRADKSIGKPLLACFKAILKAIKSFINFRMKDFGKILLSLQKTFTYNGITCRDLHYLAHDSARQALPCGLFFAFSASIQSFQKAYSSMSRISGNTDVASA